MVIEHYNRLARLAQAHVPITVEIDIDVKFTGDHEHGFDTVAEIPGTDPRLKNEVVMVGGHLDSWISGTGATDNGAGSVVAMEAMRILKSLGVAPRRTLRIALWSGEEEGLFGSSGYVEKHFGYFNDAPADLAAPSYARQHGPLVTTLEWENLDAYYNLDNGTGMIRGIYAQSNFAIGPIFQQWILPILASQPSPIETPAPPTTSPSTPSVCPASSSSRTRWTISAAPTTRIWIPSTGCMPSILSRPPSSKPSSSTTQRSATR